MPKRTNDFQKLLFLVEKQLAPLGATIEESAMLPERGTGELREVDILIALNEGQHRVKIGIECQDKSRPATKQWVEGIAKKHEELGINKTILVSASGFYSAAKRKAAALFITALDFTGVDETDWPSEVLRDLKIYVRDRSSKIIKLGWGYGELADGVTRKLASNLRGAVGLLPDGREIGIFDVVQHYGNAILEQAVGNDDGPAFAVGRMHEDIRFFRKGHLIGIATHIFLWWKHTTKLVTIRLTPYRYRGRVVAHGSATRLGITWTATAIAEESGIVRISVEAPGSLKTRLHLSSRTPVQSSGKAKRELIKSACKIPAIPKA